MTNNDRLYNSIEDDLHLLFAPVVVINDKGTYLGFTGHVPMIDYFLKITSGSQMLIKLKPSVVIY